MSRYEILHGDCIEKMKELPDNSVDAVVTDPPYELGFMGKDWDNAGIAYNVAMWRECLRVLKPGGHLLSFGGTRTYHRMACAIEDAGFEVRDSIHWMYGSGFPKSLDVSKALDKAAKVKRERVPLVGGALNSGTANGWNGSSPHSATAPLAGTRQVDEPVTDSAREWHGWGTALKPAHEPIVVARKPLVGTIAANVLSHGTGALNIDGCRVDSGPSSSVERRKHAAPGKSVGATGWTTSARPTAYNEERPGELAGRWPSNTVFSHLPECAENTCAEGCAVKGLDEQSGTRTSGKPGVRRKPHETGSMSGRLRLTGEQETGYGDSGGASRFFPVFRYQAKASKKDRGESNNHPTVKPVDLMRWLVRLVTLPGGLILDPFTGSGTTGVAAILEGFRFVGCEREDEYFAIAKARLDHAIASVNDKKGVQPTLFDLETP